MSHEGVRVDAFSVVPGQGVECLVSKPGWGEYYVRVGSRGWAKGEDNEDVTGDDEVTKLRHEGNIAVYVSVLAASPEQSTLRLQRRRVIAVLGIVDPVTKEATSTVSALQ